MKTVFLIDGFNFYHSISPLPKRFRWVDYRALCLHFLPPGDTLARICCFSAYATWRRADKTKRHEVFIEACKARSIEVVLGKFKKKRVFCDNCKTYTKHHEEKYTDVNIALTAYRLAAKGEAEQIFFITGDTDLVPAMKAIKSDFPSVRIGVVFPLNTLSTKEFGKVADTACIINLSTLKNTLLPEVLQKPNKERIKCPQPWLKDLQNPIEVQQNKPQWKNANRLRRYLYKYCLKLGAFLFLGRSH